MSRFKIFAKSISIPIIVGGAVGLITSNAINYNDLIQPAFAPPSFLFPIVWTVLYVLMGVSYGIFENKGLVDAETNSIYYSQLTVNALWSFIFFAFKWRFFAFIWILILDALVIDMIIKFYKKDKTAGLLQIPYLLWILFATVLNLAVYLLNK